MKKRVVSFLIVGVIVFSLCSCFQTGPHSVPLNQSIENVVKIDLLDGRNEDLLFDSNTYDSTILYSLADNECVLFMEELDKVVFYMPLLEPARHLGEIAVRIFYEDGTSDLIGSNCHYYLASNYDISKRGVAYPDEEMFYGLFAQFVDSQLLPR